MIFSSEFLYKIYNLVNSIHQNRLILVNTFHQNQLYLQKKIL